MKDQGKATPLLDQTLKGFFWVASGKAAQAFLRILIVAVLARLIGPAEFGVMAAAQVVIGFSVVFLELGVAQALVQKTDLKSAHLETAQLFSLLMGLLFYMTVYSGAGMIAHFFGIQDLVDILPVLGILFVMGGVTLVGNAMIIREMRFKQLASIDILSYSLGYGLVGVILALYGIGVWALVFGATAQGLLRMILIFALSKQPYVLSFNLQALKDLLYYGGGVTAARLGNYFASQGDNLVTAKMLGAVSLGYYSRAYAIMVMPVTLFGSILNKVLFPAMSKVQNNKKKLAEAYLTAISTIAVIAVPIGMMIFYLSSELVVIILGPGWEETAKALSILALGLFFRMGYKVSDALSGAVGTVYRRAWRQWVFATLVILGAYIGTHWGVAGVAWGVVFALAVNYVLMANLSFGNAGISLAQFLSAHKSGIIMGLTALAIWPVVILFREHVNMDLFRIAAVLMIYSALLGLLVYIFPRTVLDPRSVSMLERLLKMTFRYDKLSKLERNIKRKPLVK